MSVWLLPIEPFEERYTADWLRWWPDGLRAAGLDVELVLGAQPVGERAGGEFLDPTATWQWKGTQVAELARRWAEVQDGDVVLTLDVWGPATTAALYMRHTTGRRVRVVGFYHAGASDPHDFLARTGCRTWALDVERGWARGCDLLLCGSRAAERMLRDNLGVHDDPTVRGAHVAVTGYPIMRGELLRHASPWALRERLVVFPHRLAPEKQPEQFDALRGRHAALYPDAPATTWVRSRDVYAGKESYHQLLGRARVVVSTATQETFGIAMQEGIALGAWAVAPRRLSYPEVVRPGSGHLYDDLTAAAHAVERSLQSDSPPTWDGYHERAVQRAAQAILELS